MNTILILGSYSHSSPAHKSELLTEHLDDDVMQIRHPPVAATDRVLGLNREGASVSGVRNGQDVAANTLEGVADAIESLVVRISRYAAGAIVAAWKEENLLFSILMNV